MPCFSRKIITLVPLLLLMDHEFQNILNKYNFKPNQKLLLAISGGIDSMVLLHLFQRSNIPFAVAHCNFKLRGLESDQDTAFVAEYCQRHKIQLFIKNFDTQEVAADLKLSIQLAARKLRYEWFLELKSEHDFDYIVTAHHLDDSLETFLINLSRGTGLEGLLGIQDSESTIRPLLNFSRKQIERYAHEKNIDWKEDLTNASDKYLRNKIRLHVVPLLKELNTDFLGSYAKTISNLKESQSFIEESVVNVLSEVKVDDEGVSVLCISKLKKVINYEFVLYKWLAEYGFTAWQDIYNLVDAQSGKYVESPNFRLLKNRNELILSTKTKLFTEEEFFISESVVEIINPIKLCLKEVKEISDVNNQYCAYVDKSLLKFPLKLRKYKEGEYFYPFGMKNQKKKISKFFKDEKLSVLEKENIWLLYSDNRVVWVVGMRLDERFKVTENTTSIIKIEYLK